MFAYLKTIHLRTSPVSAVTFATPQALFKLIGQNTMYIKLPNNENHEAESPLASDATRLKDIYQIGA